MVARHSTAYSVDPATAGDGNKARAEEAREKARAYQAARRGNEPDPAKKTRAQGAREKARAYQAARRESESLGEKLDSESEPGVEAFEPKVYGTGAVFKQPPVPPTAASVAAVNDTEPKTGSYQPKVSTWGMFPRPKDISKEFGGGRIIRPEDLEESEEVKKEREKRIEIALAKYRGEAYIEVGPEIIAQFNKTFDEATNLMESNQFNKAAEAFKAAADLLPRRTLQAGRALLQQAICIDSLGRAQEAQALYNALRTHPSIEITKKVKELSFGFEAAQFLKIDKNDKMNAMLDPNRYKRFFDAFVSQEILNREDIKDLPSEPLDPKDVALAAGVIMLPFFLLIAVQSYQSLVGGGFAATALWARVQ